MDWKAVKTEYITTNTSYRKLAAKYGVTHNTIGQKARKEGWIEERERYIAKTMSKTLEAISDAQADRASRLRTVADKLLDKIESYVDSMDSSIDTQSCRQIAATLKDLKDIQMIKSDADMREQEARIANLQKQAEKDNDSDDRPCGVVLIPCVAETPTPPEDDDE